MNAVVSSQMTAEGNILDCLTCGMNFHKTGFDGLMEWATHICQPLQMVNYTGSWEPFEVPTNQGPTIEYRWCCAIPANRQ